MLIEKKTIYTASKLEPATSSSINISLGLSLLKECSEEGTSLNIDEGHEKTEEKATNTVEGADNQNIIISKNTLSIGKPIQFKIPA